MTFVIYTKMKTNILSISMNKDFNYWVGNCFTPKRGDRRGCNRKVVGFTTTYAIIAYHH